MLACVASSFYTHICQSIRQTQKRTKPSYTSDDIILFLMWLQHIATPLFHYATCYVKHACSMCNANAYIYSLLYLYVSTGVSLFHVSINVLSVMAHVDDKYLQWFSPFSRYGCFDNCLILRGVRLPQAYIPLLVVHAPFLNLFFRSHSFFQCKFSVMLR